MSNKSPAENGFSTGFGGRNISGGIGRGYMQPSSNSSGFGTSNAYSNQQSRGPPNYNSDGNFNKFGQSCDNRFDNTSNWRDPPKYNNGTIGFDANKPAPPSYSSSNNFGQSNCQNRGLNGPSNWRYPSKNNYDGTNGFGASNNNRYQQSQNSSGYSSDKRGFSQNSNQFNDFTNDRGFSSTKRFDSQNNSRYNDQSIRGSFANGSNVKNGFGRSNNYQLNSDSSNVKTSGTTGNRPSFGDNTAHSNSFNNTGWGGFGTFEDDLGKSVDKRTTNDFYNKPPGEPARPVTKEGGGFMDWTTVEAEMKRIETQRWADLPSLKKALYKEHPEITAMADNEVEAFRRSKNDTSVKDLNLSRTAPRPVKTFQHAFHQYPEILAEVCRHFQQPSPIQCQMWPVIMSGFDAIGIAQTGTGKTLAFLLPIFLHLDNQPIPCKDRKGPGCLILSPTRELALQIHAEVKKYRYKGMRSVCLYGGGSRKEQVESCLEGIDIIIATPGRLMDLVDDNVVNLRSITFVVLDEADRMLDMGFEPQIKRILYNSRPDRQTVMTSATWPPGVRRLAESYTKDPFLIVIGSLDLQACTSVTQVVQVIPEEEKRERLFDFLHSLQAHEKIIVFVGKKSIVDHIVSDLNLMGVCCNGLHGDKEQSERERALKAFRTGEIRILIATDVASRGLDIVDITHVLNYDFPQHMEEYVHRVGRTGRAGRAGVSVTYMTRYDWRHSSNLIKLLEQASQEIPYDLRKMSQRYELKLLENPDMFRRKPREFSMDQVI